MSIFQQRDRALSLDRRLIGRHANAEIRTRHDGETRELVVQSGEVECFYLVGVLRVGLSGERPALVFLPEPKQVLRELNASRREGRVERQRETLGGGAIGELILLRKFPADQMVDARIVRPARERGFAMAHRGHRIPLHLRDYRTQRVGFWRVRIHLQSEIEMGRSEITAFAIDEVFRE